MTVEENRGMFVRHEDIQIMLMFTKEGIFLISNTRDMIIRQKYRLIIRMFRRERLMYLQ